MEPSVGGAALLLHAQLQGLFTCTLCSPSEVHVLVSNCHSYEGVPVLIVSDLYGIPVLIISDFTCTCA